jgi:hypothetical protein
MKTLIDAAGHGPDLKPDDNVHLKWSHDYVTRNRSSSPEQTITLLEKRKD